MARISNDQRLANLHAEALAQFDDIQTALKDERLQCLQDRRFYSLAGSQWEGPLEPGLHTLVVGELPMQINADSLRAGAHGTARALFSPQ